MVSNHSLQCIRKLCVNVFALICTSESPTRLHSFINSRYALAEHCNYGTLYDELIRDRIIVGIVDRAVRAHANVFVVIKDGLLDLLFGNKHSDGNTSRAILRNHSPHYY